MLVLPEGVSYETSGGNNCFSAAVALMMYRIDADREFWYPERIDEVINREEGHPTEGAEQVGRGILLLLEHGARVEEILDFDQKTYEREGISYLERKYPDWLEKNPTGFYSFFTDSYVTEDIEQRSRFLELVRPFGERYAIRQVQPSIEILDELRREGNDTLACVDLNPETQSVQQVVVLREDSETSPNIFRVFDNRHLDPECPVENWTRETLSRSMLPEEGLIAVRRA